MSITRSTISLGQPRFSGSRLVLVVAMLLLTAGCAAGLIAGVNSLGGGSRADVHRSVPYEPAIHFYGTGAPPVVSVPVSTPAPQRATAYPRADDFYGAS